MADNSNTTKNAEGYYRKRMIDRDKMLQGDSDGIHILEKPLNGYKIVNCKVEYSSLFTISNWLPFLNFNETKIEKCVAKLKIPTGTTILRPYIFNNTPASHIFNYEISDKLRTSTYTITDIVPTSLCDKTIPRKVVDATSYDNSRYEKDKTYGNNLEINKKDGVFKGGLYFFLNRKNAEEYDKR
jgi:hypothetical protein